MATRNPDGTIQMSDGTILYDNTLIKAGHLKELLDVLMASPGWSAAAAAAQEIMKTSTEGFLREVRKELDQRTLTDKRVPIPTEAVLLESRFRTLDNRVFNFSLQKGRGYAELSIGQARGGGLTIGMGAVLDRHEVDRARSLLGIKKLSPLDYWLRSCVEAMKELGRLERRNKLHMRLNRKTMKSQLRIEEPKGRKG